MEGIADPPTSGSFGPLAPLPLRWALSSFMSFMLAVLVLTLVPREEVAWRLTGIAAGTMVAFAVVLRLRTKTQPPAESPPPLPEGLDERIASLVTQTVEHADRTAVAWASIAITVHSLIALALSKLNRPHDLQETSRTMIIYAMALLVLASVTLPGAHAISMSAERARRAISVAREHAILGPLYNRIYQGEAPEWQTDLLGITMNAFGKVWLWVGFLLIPLGILLNAI